MQGSELLIFLEGHVELKGEGTGVFQPTAWSELMRLINGSSLTVTEDMPTSPYAQWLQVPACSHEQPVPPLGFENAANAQLDMRSAASYGQL